MRRYLQKLDTLGLVLMVAAALYYSVTNLWDRWSISLAVAGAVLVVVGLAASYKQILDSLGQRSTKYAGNYVISLILVIAIVSALNFLGQRHVKRFDLTSLGRFSLAPQTIQVLEKLDQEMDVKAFFPEGDYPPLRELLVGYRAVNRNLRYEFIDPDRQPDVAQRYDVTAYGTFSNPFTGTQLKFGTVVLMYGDRRETIEKRSEEVREEDLTNAIIKLQRSETKTVYFVQGHEEKDTSSTEREGYSSAMRSLEQEGYKVETLNLASGGTVPPDARVVVLPGPRIEPFAQEMEYLNDFLNRGGGLLVMVDPPPAASLAPFLKRWGVTVRDAVVLDVSGAGRLMGAGPTIPLVLQYQSHKITDRFRAMSFFPLVRAVEPSEEAVEGVTVEGIFQSNPDSWGETDFGKPEASFDENVDFEGPLTLAVAVTKEITPATDDTPALMARMVVVGDSDFAVNAHFAMQGNGNLFLNMVSWLAQEEDLISIRPKSPQDRRVIMSQSQQSLLRLVAVFLLPGAVLVAGIVVYTKRRK